MNMPKTDNEHIDLIAKYLAGEASPDEAMALHDWLQKPGNFGEYQKLVRLWHTFPASGQPGPVNRLQAWRDLEQLLDASASNPDGKKRKLYPSWYLIAACFLGFMIMVGLKFFNPGHEDSPGPGINKKITYIKEASNEILIDTLPDNSKVTLNKNSSISFGADFNFSERAIVLKGEAFFEITPNKEKTFTVSVDDLNIRVVGTSFNIHCDSGSSKIEVQVRSGIVKIMTTTDEKIVTKGQTGIYNKLDKSLAVRDGIDNNSFAYATRSFVFNDLPLETACHYLEKAFNVNFFLDKEKFSNCRITSQFDNKSLSYILEIMNATLNTKTRQVQNAIYLTGNGCQ